MIPFKDVTVVLLNYKRPWNIPPICESLIRTGFTEIIVRDQSPQEYHEIFPIADAIPAGVRLIREENVLNVRTLGRFLVLDKVTARPFIATQDDDYIITDLGWSRILHQEYKGICCQLPQSNLKFEQAYELPFVNIGYGSVYPKRLAVEFIKQWSERYGAADPSLVRKGDRCFTAWAGKWLALPAYANTLKKLWNPGGELSENDQNSISLTDEHWPDTWKAVIKARELSASRTQMVREFPTCSNN